MSEDNIISFIYLAGILFLFLPFLIKSGKKGLVQITIWIIIILFIIFAYSYRYEFKDVKSRIYMELFPGKATHLSNNRIIINSSQNKHFYIETLINNKNVKFMVDTGASNILLSYIDAKRIGINMNRLKFNKIYNTANGTIFGATIYLDLITIADIEFRNIKVSISKSNMDQSLLGMDFLRRFRKYEFSRDRLILEYYDNK